MHVGFQPFLIAFDRLVNFLTGLPDKEQPAQQQDNIAQRDGLIEHGEQRVGELHHPGDRSQQPQTHHHRPHQP